MGYIIRPFKLGKINLATTSRAEEVLQNVAIIVSTIKGSVPHARELGISQRYLDMPINIARQSLSAAILDAVQSFERRAEIVNITFETDINTPSKLMPILEVNILDE